MVRYSGKAMNLKQAELELNARAQELAEVMDSITTAMDKHDWNGFDALTARFMQKSDELLAAQQNVRQAS